MKRKVFSVLFVLVLVLGLSLATVLPALANPALYEYYNQGDDNASVGPAGSGWYAQTFTAESDHSVTSIKLKLGRMGSPGNITVSIRATDVNGHPTGSDLASGATDGNTLPTESPWEWREITVTPSCELSSGTKYAIVIRALDAYTGNYPRVRFDSAPGGYAGGNYELSFNSGVSWSTGSADIDFMFEIHGPEPSELVDIDMKPGGDPNSINLKSKGVVPVAILTTAGFDASTVNASTVELTGSLGSAFAVKWEMLDVPEVWDPVFLTFVGDGDLDLVLYFSTPELAAYVIASTDTEATVTGETFGGTPIEGTDSVRIAKA